MTTATSGEHGNSAVPVAVTPNLFGVAFGVAGLGATWQSSDAPGARAVAGMLFAVSGAALLVVTVAWARSSRAHAESWSDAADRTLRDRRFGPFVSLAPITAALLASQLPWTVAAHAGVLTATALCWVLAGVLLGGWIRDGVDVDQIHAGYFLPTVAGGFVTANALAVVGSLETAMVAFGAAVIFWLLLGPVILSRLVTRPPLPLPLQPTSAINLAPAVVGANAWNAVTGGRVDVVSHLFAGVALVLVLVEVVRIPVYRRVPFGPGYWSFAFVAAAAATWAMRWIEHALPAEAAHACGGAVLATVTAFVGAIAAVTALRLWQGRFLPSARGDEPSGVPTGATASAM